MPIVIMFYNGSLLLKFLQAIIPTDETNTFLIIIAHMKATRLVRDESRKDSDTSHQLPLLHITLMVVCLTLFLAIF